MSEPEYPPYTFADPLKRRWELKLNYGLKNSIKATTGVDIARVAVKGLKAIGALLDDDEKFMQALWILVESQAKTAKVEPEEFAECFDGPTCDAAANAFVEAVVLFSLPQSRDNMRAALEKAVQVAKKTGAMAIENIDVEREAKSLSEQSGVAQAS